MEFQAEMALPNLVAFGASQGEIRLAAVSNQFVDRDLEAVVDGLAFQRAYVGDGGRVVKNVHER